MESVSQSSNQLIGQSINQLAYLIVCRLFNDDLSSEELFCVEIGIVVVVVVVVVVCKLCFHVTITLITFF